MIPYLSDFWDAITGATEFGVTWFQDLGNAVAGALGNILLYPLRELVGFLLAFGYLISRLYIVFGLFLSPIWFVYYWVVSMVTALGTTAASTPVFTVMPAALAFFTSLPYFSTLFTTLSACLFFLALWQTFNIIRHM